MDLRPSSTKASVIAWISELEEKVIVCRMIC
jgi:hypothetical protein